ncbi:MAG: dimethyl sulfoxide reductase anchor subunit [Gemmatimonadales bacterium]|nr:dimethyl sulfoxide reductase anchor subunit [Gemmatimonadales bacterium]NIN12742.1 dimethyl sulfoxide reductase anchor subunit [Gemmatimonadales bacterium]NIQ99645.1 dimethyl sulfoxide reductase anchor subunit [Gemmatimonadales bacterium]
MDPKVNGQIQTQWGWLVAIYLFLGGVGAGAYTIAAINGFIGEGAELSTTVGLWISFPALLIGSACLLADLGSPTRALLSGMRPGSSWIARGFWIITIFMILAFLHFLLHSYTDVGQTSGGRTVLNVIAVAGIVFAVLTMAYTGILLGASKGIPFWRSGVVPVVFVVSALVTGHFSIMLGMTLVGQGAATVQPLRTMALEAAVLVVLEVLAIVFFLQAAYKLPDPRESAERIMRRRSFIVGYFILGLATPLVLMLIVYRSMTQPDAGSNMVVVAVGAVLGLVGGLILRQAVLVCGALPTLNIAGFQFRRIARPKEPKPGIGMLPPQ